VLVELNLVEQRYKAVLEVLDGATVTDVAKRNGVSRQTVHTWLRRYANEGLGSNPIVSRRCDGVGLMFSVPAMRGSPTAEQLVIEIRLEIRIDRKFEASRVPVTDTRSDAWSIRHPPCARLKEDFAGPSVPSGRGLERFPRDVLDRAGVWVLRIGLLTELHAAQEHAVSTSRDSMVGMSVPSTRCCKQKGRRS
jgi:transposase-like protein